MFARIKKVYEEKYKLLLIIPCLLLVLAFLQIGFQYAATGEFVQRGVSLKGGISVSLPDHFMPVDELEQVLNAKFPIADIDVRTISDTGLLIEASDVTEKQLLDALKAQFGDLGDYSVGEIGSSLGASFFREIFTALIVAFLFISIVVFITFRVPIPSFSVILAIFSDMVVTIAILNIMEVKLSTSGIAALLMLIGYSVDTDILLNTRVLKRKEGSIMDRIYGSIKTGMTMTITTLVALIAGLLLSNSETISQIMLILLIGLLVDIPMTWIQNAGMLRWYLERKNAPSMPLYPSYPSQSSSQSFSQSSQSSHSNHQSSSGGVR